MANPEGQQDDYSFRPVPRAGLQLPGEDRSGIEVDDFGLLCFASDIVDESLAETIHESASPSPGEHDRADEQPAESPGYDASIDGALSDDASQRFRSAELPESPTAGAAASSTNVMALSRSAV